MGPIITAGAAAIASNLAQSIPEARREMMIVKRPVERLRSYLESYLQQQQGSDAIVAVDGETNGGYGDDNDTDQTAAVSSSLSSSSPSSSSSSTCGAALVEICMLYGTGMGMGMGTGDGFGFGGDGDDVGDGATINAVRMSRAHINWRCHHATEEVLSCTLLALRHIAVDYEMRPLLVKQGAVPAILAMLQTNASTSTNTSTNISTSTSTNTSTSGNMAMAGSTDDGSGAGVTTTTTTSSTSSTSSMAVAVSERMMLYCSETLRYLSLHDSTMVRSQLVRDGALDTLIAIFMQTTDTDTDTGAGIAGSAGIAGGVTGVTGVVAGGSVSGYYRVLVHAGEALANLAGDPRHVHDLLAANTV
jgi:hypothetical protein